MRSALVALLFLSAAWAQDVTIKVDRDLQVRDLLTQAYLVTQTPILYAATERKGETCAYRFEATVARKKVLPTLLFALELADVSTREFGALVLVRPKRALATRFSVTGLDTDLEFNAPPAAWKTDQDLVGSLAAGSVKALLAKGGAVAWQILGHCAPRTAEVVDALVAALPDRHAAAALARFGFAARPALAALRQHGCDAAVTAIEAAHHPGLTNPSLARGTAPERFKARFKTTKGDFVIDVTRSWSPKAADRFYNLVRIGYYDDCAFFRVMPGFVVQWGKHGTPRVNSIWFPLTIDGEKPSQSNRRGYVTFAMRGKDRNTRSAQVFINLADNRGLDEQGFAPFGVVVEGMREVVDSLYSGYEGSIDQNRVHYEGNAFLKKHFPKLDYIKQARIVR